MRSFIFNETVGTGWWCDGIGEARIYTLIPNYKVYLFA